MVSIIYDALAGADIYNLLSEAAEVVAFSLSADHVLVLESAAISSRSCFASGIGWDQSASARLGKQLLDQARVSGSTILQPVIGSEGALPGGLYRASSTFLQEHDLRAGVFIMVPCAQGSLALFAGDARGVGSLTAESGMRSLHAIVTVLSLAVGRASTELAHIASLHKVVEAKNQWETSLDALPQLMCLIDERGRVIRANRTLEAWQLGEVTSIRGTPVHDMLHRDCTDPSCDLRARLESMSRQLCDDGRFAECTLNSGLVGDFKAHLSLFSCDSSRYQGAAAEQGYAFLLIEEIGQQEHMERLLVGYNKELEKQLQQQSTQLKAANARLQHEIREHLQDKLILRGSEKRYACFVENTLTGIYVIRNARITFYNQRFAEIFGFGRDEIYQLELHELFPSDRQWANSGNMIADNVLSQQTIVEGKTRDGGTIWLQRSLNLIDSLQESMILGNVVDVTAQKNAEDALRSSERELRSLSDKLLLAQEAERKRIALELHDGIGQSLSAIKFSVEHALQGWEDQSSQQNGQYLQDFVDKLRHAINEVRAIAMGLRPSVLDDLGLVTTIGWLCREFQSIHTTIRIEERIDIEESDVPEPLKIVVFRIIQEALNNIAKHAMATNVSVELAKIADKLTLRIRDDGQGISPQVLQAATGLGLVSMKERAQLTCGDFAIETTCGKGTVVQVLWHRPGD